MTTHNASIMPISAVVRYSGAVVIVTGGSKGIGRGIAEAFIECGAEVVVCGRRPPATLPTVGGRSARFVACDVRDPESVSALFAQVAADQGRLDVLVNNAGGGPPMEAATASAVQQEKVVKLNLLGPLYCAQAAYRIMAGQDTGGSIINIASVAGARPSPGSAIYGASKAALLSLTESLAMEWGPKVRVNAIIVGLVATEAADAHYGGAAGVARIDAMLPLKRMGRPRDVADACLYLGSPLAAYVSGAQLAVHGGGERPVFLYLAEPSKKEGG